MSWWVEPFKRWRTIPTLTILTRLGVMTYLDVRPFLLLLSLEK